MIMINDVTEELINQKVSMFIRETGDSEEVIKRLFIEADNNSFDDILFRAAMIDLVYSTCVQRFNKGGIVALTKHLLKHSNIIQNVIDSNEIDYDAFYLLANMDYSGLDNIKGREARVASFVSKFLSFSNENVYPIMDSNVKRAMGLSESTDYEQFSKEVLSFKDEIYKRISVNLSLKELDMFLWQWTKDDNN